MAPDNFLTMRLPSLLSQGPDSGLYMVVRVSEAESQVILDLTLCEVTDAPKKSANTVEMISLNVCEDANIIANPTIMTRYGDEVQFKMGDNAGETFSFTALPKRL